MIFYNITAGKADVSAAPAALQPLLKAAFQRNPNKRPKAAELAEQTARMFTKPPGGMPDEISTVPRPDAEPPPVESLLPPHDPSVTPPYGADRPYEPESSASRAAAPSTAAAPSPVAAPSRAVGLRLPAGSSLVAGRSLVAALSRGAGLSLLVGRTTRPRGRRRGTAPRRR